MSKVRVAAFSVSIDGFGAGPRQDFAEPAGVPRELHAGSFKPRYSRARTAKAAG